MAKSDVFMDLARSRAAFQLRAVVHVLCDRAGAAVRPQVEPERPTVVSGEDRARRAALVAEMWGGPKKMKEGDA